jgi:RHH-type transcriptional regulator, proline utilization regulon repressor / proline dehydrogenase / delta 1-pyrroline-5-carboxylate dehydrogenase
VGGDGPGRRFIAGATPREVLAAAESERRRQHAFTLDVLGEAVTSETEADRYLAQYLELLQVATPAVAAWPAVPQIDVGPDGPEPRLNVSVKLSALDGRFDPLEASTWSRTRPRT